MSTEQRGDLRVRRTTTATTQQTTPSRPFSNSLRNDSHRSFVDDDTSVGSHRSANSQQQQQRQQFQTPNKYQQKADKNGNGNPLIEFKMCIKYNKYNYCDKCPNGCGFAHIQATAVPWTKPLKGPLSQKLEGQLCNEFEAEQYCSKGENCPFVHVVSPMDVPASDPYKSFQVCGQFRTEGFCARCPNNCNLDHIVPSALLWSQPNQQLPPQPKGISCPQFDLNQTCSRGDKCKRVHVLSAYNVPRSGIGNSQPKPQPPQPQSQTDLASEICSLFHSTGYCSKCPSKCKKKHVVESGISWTKRGVTPPETASYELCQSFRDTQTCPNDTTCKYLHILQPSKVPTGERFEVCREFHNDGFCSLCPADCHLDHINPSAVEWTKLGANLPDNPSGIPCGDFQRDQKCKYGEACRNIHVVRLENVPSSFFHICQTFRDRGFCPDCPDKCKKMHILPTEVSWSKFGVAVPVKQDVKLCQAFKSTGECSKGKICKYLHVVDPSKVDAEATRTEFRVCEKYRKTGFCSNCPDHCEFSHIVPTKTPWTNPEKELPETPKGILCREFLHHQTCRHNDECKYVHVLDTKAVPVPRTIFRVCEQFRDDGFCSACPDKCNKTHVVETKIPWSKIRAKLPSEPTAELCQQFRDSQECVNGGYCKYLHVVDASKVPSTPTLIEFSICQQYRNEGYCANCPDHCTLSHVVPSSASWTKPNGSLPVDKRPQGVLCRAFQKYQNCSKHNCGYIHVLYAKSVSNIPPVSQSKVPSASKSKVPSASKSKFSVCLQFRDNGFCSHCPTECKRNHVKPTKVSWTHPDQEMPNNPTIELCQRFRDFQNCDMDTSCPYLHVVNPNDVPTKPPKALENKRQASASLDIVLVMDCTDKMDLWLAAAKDQLSKIAKEIESNVTTARLGFVGFRDYDNCPPESRIVSTGLTSDIAVVQNVLNGATAFGAGDMPDDVVGGLQAALEMQWDAPHRMIVLMTDAPCHGKKYHDCFMDNRSDPIDGEPNIEDQMREMAQRGISFVMIEVSHSRTRKMVPYLESAFKEVDTAKKLLFTIAQYDGSPKEVNDVGECFKKTIVNSIAQRLPAKLDKPEKVINSRSPVPPKRGLFEKAEDLDDDTLNPWLSELSTQPWNWNGLSETVLESAICFTFSIDLKTFPFQNNSSSIHERKESRDVKIADKSYFGQGHMRTAHEFMDNRSPTLQYVAMVFKHTKAHNLETYKQDAREKVLALARSAIAAGSKGTVSVSIYELTDRPSIDYFKFITVELGEEYLSMHLDI